MRERSIDSRGSDDQAVMDIADGRRLYDLVVRPPDDGGGGSWDGGGGGRGGGGGEGGGEEPPCDCAGPPPQFLLPPPPVDPSWAAEGEDVCDIVAPYQVCRGLTGGSSAGAGGTTGLPMLAVVLTASGLLLVLLLVAALLFCRYRRRSRSLLSSKGSGKRADTSLLYDGLPVQTQVIPNNLRSNGHAPHIEMVAVKGQPCAQLMPGGRGGVGTLFVYPPPPSLTDDGSEQLSNMYEEIPYYGRPAPSVSCCSDSDDDIISRPSEEELTGGGGGGGGVARPSYLPAGSSEPRYVRTLPSGPPGGGGGGGGGTGRHGGQTRPRSADRRRPSPASPASARPSVRRDASLRRKDPYYYSDILARDAAGDEDPSAAYRAPYDERRPSSRSGGGGALYSQPDVAGGDMRSPNARGPSHGASLSSRIALDPFSDSYGNDRASARRQRHKPSSFGPGAGVPREPMGPGARSPERAYLVTSAAPGQHPGDGDTSRYRPPLQWTH